jgi:hypothetical protein
MSAAKFHKGNAVRVRPGREFSPNYVWRRLTEEEREAWYASDASKGMDSAGESKLCPRDVSKVPGDELYRVVRARVRTTRGWHDVGNCTELEDEHGVRWYAYRRDLY